jgi:hypothetical protein
MLKNSEALRAERFENDQPVPPAMRDAMSKAEDRIRRAFEEELQGDQRQRKVTFVLNAQA